MKIEELSVKSLKPYENNPRINEPGVDAVANSIREFGFRVPILVDADNVIIAGHTRQLAAEKLGLTKVPVVRITDLTPEQVKAFRIADNSTAEKSQWDFDKLEIELGDITLDMTDFGLEYTVPEAEDEYSDEQNEFDFDERTYSATNFCEYDENRVEGRYDMPTLDPVDCVPKKMIGFNYIKTSDEYDACVHFFIDDYQFERVWNRPHEYIPMLKKFDCALTPNYSICLDMPEAIKIWNTYRARLLGQMMQTYGVKTIPIVYWSDERSYEYCFDGLPIGGTLAVNNIGIQAPETKRLWDAGMDELIRRKKPKRILIYGNGVKPDYEFGDIPVLYYTNEVTSRMKEGAK